MILGSFILIRGNFWGKNSGNKENLFGILVVKKLLFFGLNMLVVPINMTLFTYSSYKKFHRILILKKFTLFLNIYETQIYHLKHVSRICNLPYLIDLLNIFEKQKHQYLKIHYFLVDNSLF